MLNWTTGEISPNFIDFNSGNGSFKFSLIKLNLLGAGFTHAASVRRTELARTALTRQHPANKMLAIIDKNIIALSFLAAGAGDYF